MKLLALTLLIAIMQAAPRKAPSNAAGKNHKTVQSDSTGNQHSLNRTSPIQPDGESTPEHNPGQQLPGADTSKPRVIPELSTVSAAHKDIWDKAYVVFTGALVLVGFSGAYLAWRTLKAIDRQALSMRRQTTLLRRSVFAARSNSEAALLNAQAVINAERPWVVVVVIPPLSGNTYSFEASNQGRTPAEIISVDAKFGIFDQEDDIPIPQEAGTRLAHRVFLVPMRDYAPIPKTTASPMQPQFSPTFNVYMFFVDTILQGQGDAASDLRQSRKYLVAYGVIVYADVLTKKIHRTRFCYRWNPAGGVLRAGLDGANDHT